MNFCCTFVVMLFSMNLYAQSLTYEGTLFDSSGAVIAETGVILKAEIFDDTLTCILYEREYSLDLSGSNGHFTLNLSSGTAPSAQPHTANTLTQILSNASGNNITCANSAVRNFTGIFVKRQIRVSILEVNLVDIVDIQLPAQDLELTPFANEAETAKLFTGILSGDVTGTSNATQVTKIQGVDVDTTAPADGQILKYDNGLSKYVPSVIDSSIISDNSVTVDDLDFASSNGIDIPTLAADPGTPSAGQIYYNSVDNKVYFYNGTGWIDTGAGGGDFLANGSVALTGNVNLNGNYLSGDGDNEGVFVDATGNVGIGTTSPNDPMEIMNTVPEIRLSDSDGGYAVVSGSGGHVSLHADPGNTQIGSRFSVDIDGAERLRIDSSGNVGIGTTTPGRIVEIKNDMAVIRMSDSSATKNSNGQHAAIEMNDSSGTPIGFMGFNTAGQGLTVANYNSTGDIGFYTDSSTKMTIDGDTGNVGIGTTSPGEKLEVSGNIKGTQLCIGADCRAAWPSGGTVTQVDAGTGLTGGSVITATGTIGLADTAVTAGSFGSATQVPSFTVDAQGRLTAAANVSITDNDTTYSTVTGVADGLMIAADKTKLDAIEASATADQTPTEILTAVKTVDGAASGLDADLLDAQSGAYYLDYSNFTNTPTVPDGHSLDAADGSPSDSLFVDNSGNVGIGTAAPNVKLDVNGSIRSRVIDGTIFYMRGETSDSGTPIADGMIIRYEENLFGAALDGILFEKTDFNAADPDGGFIFANRGNDGVREVALSIKGNGNVGIGTTSPPERLSVKSKTNTITDYPINLQNLSDTMRTGLGVYGLSNKEGTAQNIDFTLDIGGDLIMSPGGNVGIGTTSPNAKLTVEGVVTLDEQTGDPTGTAGYGSVYAKMTGNSTTEMVLAL